MDQSVPKRRHIKFRRRGITQKKVYNIQNRANVLNKKIHTEFFVIYLFRQFAASCKAFSASQRSQNNQKLTVWEGFTGKS